MSGPLPLSYVLPLRWSEDAGREELTRYLLALQEHCADIIIVDGSGLKAAEQQILSSVPLVSVFTPFVLR